MTRLRALFLVTVLWAAIYLPGLGSTEIKGEEGRRILPAVTMLDGGSWLVPYVGGKPFLRKPPLVNWMIAGSFKLTSVRNEWTARLPSALCVLALGLTLVGLSSGPGWMRAEAGFTTAIFAMTGAGLLAKARFAGAEIEGIYVPLSGIGIACWMAWWTQRRSPWLTWTVPFVFFGLAALAKAPLHLVFFYAIVGATLWRARALRELLSAPHAAGVVIMLAIFAAWAVPYFQTEDAMKAGKVWKDQFAGRVTENAFNVKTWALAVPRGLLDQLPWLLFAPLLWARRGGEGSDRLAALRTGALWAVAACFVALLLVPGVLTRYVLPLGIPFCVLLALRLHEPGDLQRPLRLWHRANIGVAGVLVLAALATPFAAAVALDAGTAREALMQIDVPLAVRAALFSTWVLVVCAVIVARRPVALTPSGLAIGSAALLGAGATLYATAAVRWMGRADNVRPIAAQIDAAVAKAAPAGAKARLVLFDPGWEPAIFYLRTPYEYAAKVNDIRADAELVLVRAEDAGERAEQLERFAKKRPELELIDAIATRDGEALLLLRRRDAIPQGARP